MKRMNKNEEVNLVKEKKRKESTSKGKEKREQEKENNNKNNIIESILGASMDDSM
jgi:hypothetical protein